MCWRPVSRPPKRRLAALVHGCGVVRASHGGHTRHRGRPSPLDLGRALAQLRRSVDREGDSAACVIVHLVHTDSGLCGGPQRVAVGTRSLRCGDEGMCVPTSHALSLARHLYIGACVHMRTGPQRNGSRMPHSTDRTLRDIRASYTGEEPFAAQAGLGRGNLGLDACAPEQRKLRALLAIQLFNYSRSDALPNGIFSVSRCLAYSSIVSPRFNQLVFITSVAADNVASSLVPRRGSLGYGVLGLRLVNARSCHTHHLRHLPTGAQVVVAAQPDFMSKEAMARMNPDKTRGISKYFADLETPLSLIERDALASIPPMTSDIETLLAALVTRLNSRCPRGNWAIGHWRDDPLGRPQSERLPWFNPSASLWGAGTHWQLRWNAFPHPRDLVASLAEPPIGITGAIAVEHSHGWQIKLNESSLWLRHTRQR